MVAILHGKGFHGLRVYPWLYPLAYRVEIYPAKFSGPSGVRYDDDLAPVMEEKRLVARHSGADQANYFGWDDVASDSAHELAIKFIDRFPQIVKAGYIVDYAYVGWYATLIAHCEYGYLPYLSAEFEPETDVMRMLQANAIAGQHQMDWFPLPPSAGNGHRFDPRPEPRWFQSN
ncbi:hypothetical protein MAA8898_04518 [Maliponia aquimaris]|uniref:Uncharacterized protein n=2 Tax=Maliponia aquimaris TaxID=1673631 RepID=A0A238L6C4_9RHOB|nr:hypothetical protein MAA8898_04518 [Maliponia aquimaris]